MRHMLRWRPGRVASAFLASAALGVLALASAAAYAETPRAVPGARTTGAPAKKDRSSAFGELGSNKQPIKIDADRLDVFDKEGRAVFAGNVVAVQGDSTMKCTLLTVFYEGGRGLATAAGTGPAGAGPASAAPDSKAAPDPKPAGGNPLGGESAIRKINCKGPVTITSKTQVATGDNAEFDRRANKVLLIGNAALSDGPNVTRGERVAYDITTGIANVEGGGGGGRVRALIVPGSGDKSGAAAKSR